MISTVNKREADRWYKLKDIPQQLSLVRDNVRFKVVPAGRRSGKTERAKRYIVRQAMKNAGRAYFLAAPTRDQAKKIFWNDLKQMTFSSLHPRQPSETELLVTLPNNATIQVIGLDKPQRIEGQLWAGGIVDEIADCKPNAWAENIKPALDTVNPQDPDYRAWCWLTGVPDGLNHFYDLAQYAQNANDSEWAFYTWKSSDILPSDVIEAAKRQISQRQFRQEYEASFETAQGRIYEDYSFANRTSETIQPHEQLLWFHDFNYTPMSSGIGVRRGDNLYCLDEIILSSAISRQSALEFVERYKNHDNKNVLIYGDPAGRAGEKHGHESDYTEMENVLKSNGWKFARNVKKAAPAIKDRQNAVRAKIMNANGERSLFVNPANAPYTDRGLATVQLKKGSTFIEEDSEVQHITTAVGYMVDYIWPIREPIREFTTRFAL